MPLDTMLGRPQSGSAGNWSWFLGLPVRDLLALQTALYRLPADRHGNICATDRDVFIIKICWYITPFRLVNNLGVSVAHSTFTYTMKYSRGLEHSSNLLWQITILLNKCCFYTEFKSLLDPILSHFWRVHTYHPLSHKIFIIVLAHLLQCLGSSVIHWSFTTEMYIYFSLFPSIIRAHPSRPYRSHCRIWRSGDCASW